MIRAHSLELRAPATDAEWSAYHAIRRRVLFELRGTGAAYDENHPDEHRPGHHPLVLWHGDAPVGVIRVDIEGEVAIFRRVAVRDDLHGRGYGRRLLEAAGRLASEHGCRRIDSFVDAGAVGFYERCGFSRVAPAAGSPATILMTRPLARDGRGSRRST